MKFINKNLNLLSNGYSKIVVFDCEFWHVLGEQGDSKYLFNKQYDFFFMPREIGGYILTKNTDNSWNLKEPFYVTLPYPKRDVAFPVSHYSTVSPHIAHRLDDLESKLGRPWGDAFPSRLTPEGKEIHKEGLKLYMLDPNIKKHHKSSAWYTTFIKELSDSMIIVKGLQDIESIQNACTYYKIKFIKPADITDIAEWNAESYKKCHTAKLEGTFRCISNKLDSETKELSKHLSLEKAHDPLTDASMTLLIALFIASKEPI